MVEARRDRWGRVAPSRADCGWQYPLIMLGDMSPPPGQVPDLVARVDAGDREAIVELMDRYPGAAASIAAWVSA